MHNTDSELEYKFQPETQESHRQRPAARAESRSKQSLVHPMTRTWSQSPAAHRCEWHSLALSQPRSDKKATPAPAPAAGPPAKLEFSCSSMSIRGRYLEITGCKQWQPWLGQHSRHRRRVRSQGRRQDDWPAGLHLSNLNNQVAGNGCSRMIISFLQSKAEAESSCGKSSWIMIWL